MPDRLKIFYVDGMVADSRSNSPSAAKPKAVVASWQQLGIPIEIIPPDAVSEEQLCLAHDCEFVRGVLSCEHDNGFGNRSAEVAASLPYTTGSLLAAARAALEEGVAVSPSSGFHHACYASAGGYCTFNGLMVTARVLKRERRVRCVGILDCDAHYGNGAEDILRVLGIDWVRHFTAGEGHFSKEDSCEFLDRLPEIVRSMNDCDLLLYQAGADAHVDDPLEAGWLDSAQLAERDRLVFEAAHDLGIPIAWNLAGGYQNPLRKVLDIHMDTQTIELVGRHRLATELLQAGLEVALPSRDRGIDLIAYTDIDKHIGKFVARPIQMKAASRRSFEICKKYEKIHGLILAFVWHLETPGSPATYALTYRECVAIADAMQWTETTSWKEQGRYSTSNPSAILCAQLDCHRMTHDSWWEKVVGTARRGS